MRIMMIGLMVMAMAAFVGCAAPAPIIVQAPPGAWKQLAERMKIVQSPRYRTAAYSGRFTLTVKNGYAYSMEVCVAAGECERTGPAGQVDIPFEKDREVTRVAPITVTWFNDRNEVVLTYAEDLHILPDKGHYRGISGTVWHITSAYPLRRID